MFNAASKTNFPRGEFTATTAQTISVVFDVSFINIRYMTEISDSQPITITAIGSDGAPYTIEIIRNDSI